MKQLAAITMLLLCGCNSEMPLFFPDKQDIHFQCDMDPYKQGCERQMDYQEHFRWIKGPAG
ncbi:hypothetical protein ACNFG0_15380 [Pseudomonas sp. NY15372]|uniref:hypothetical protein n=1 Tax=Pseudomonas sp. NY15372 TaxID=3400356 RepID=UPI003A851C74